MIKPFNQLLAHEGTSLGAFNKEKIDHDRDGNPTPGGAEIFKFLLKIEGKDQTDNILDQSSNRKRNSN